MNTETLRIIAALPTPGARARAREYWSSVYAGCIESLRDIEAKHDYRRAVADMRDLRIWGAPVA